MTRPRVSLNYCSRHRLVRPRGRRTVHCTFPLCYTTLQKRNTTTTSYKRQHQPLQIYACNVSTEISLRNHPTDSITTRNHHHVGNPFPMPSPPSPIGYTETGRVASSAQFICRPARNQYPCNKSRLRMYLCSFKPCFASRSL